MNNHYEPRIGTITDIVEEAPAIKTFTISLPESENISFLPGQFMMLTAFGVGEAPFAFSSIPNGNKFQVTIRKAGSVTGALHNLSVGAQIGFRGPLGKPFPLDELKNAEAILLVGGGIGLPPLRSLIQFCQENDNGFPKRIIFYGTRTPADFLYKEELEQWQKQPNSEVFLTVEHADQKWQGNRGVVTILFNKTKVPANSKVVMCGPDIMMKFVIKSCLEVEIDPKNIFLSLERRMCCGIGKCGNCGIEKYYVCKDGPVFTYEQIKGVEGKY